jgi:hypothetical protein
MEYLLLLAITGLALWLRHGAVARGRAQADRLPADPTAPAAASPPAAASHATAPATDRAGLIQGHERARRAHKRLQPSGGTPAEILRGHHAAHGNPNERPAVAAVIAQRQQRDQAS